VPGSSSAQDRGHAHCCPYPRRKLWAYRNATAAVNTMGTFVVRGSDGQRLAVYRLGDAESYDLRPDDDERG